MSETAVVGTSLVKITVTSDDRRLDIGIPDGIPLIEVMPGFARRLGVLDPTLVHGGYALQRVDGTRLDATLSATAQGVHSGEVLTLVRGTALSRPRVYDDVTEAVIDATAEHHRTWTPRDNSRTALAVSLAFLTLCALLLALGARDFSLTPLIAAGGAIVLLAASATLPRLGSEEAGHGFGLMAAVFAALATATVVPSEESIWGWPLAAAAGAAAVTGGVALAVTTGARQIHLMSIGWAAVVGVPAVVSALWPTATVAAYALMVAVAGVLSNALPWLAMSSTRIRVISPQHDEEIFAKPGEIDGSDVKTRAAIGARVLIAIRVGTALAMFTAVPVVAASSGWGALLVALAFSGMMFQSRQVYARSGVVTVMVMGTVGLVACVVTVALAQPVLQPTVVVVLLAATTVLVVVTLINPGSRLRFSRVADVVELTVLVSLLPLGVVTGGLA